MRDDVILVKELWEKIMHWGVVLSGKETHYSKILKNIYYIMYLYIHYFLSQSQSFFLTMVFFFDEKNPSPCPFTKK